MDNSFPRGLGGHPSWVREDLTEGSSCRVGGPGCSPGVRWEGNRRCGESLEGARRAWASDLGGTMRGKEAVTVAMLPSDAAGIG